MLDIIQTAAAIHAISRRVRDPNTNAPITFLLSRVSAGFATISMNERELIAVFVKFSVKPLILVEIIIYVENQYHQSRIPKIFQRFKPSFLVDVKISADFNKFFVI